MIEAALFVFMVILAFVIILVKFPYREFLFWLSAGIFIFLGFMVFSGEDIGYETTYTDGTNTWTEINFILGTSTDTYSANVMMLAFVLVTLGIIIGIVGLVLWLNPPKSPGA